MSLSNGAVRVIVSIFAIPLILAAIFLGKFYFVAFVLGISIFSFYEFSKLSINKGAYTLQIPTYIFITIIIINFYRTIIDDFYALILAYLLIIFIIELFRNKQSAILNLGTTLLGLMYIGLFSGSMIKIREFYGSSDLFYLQGGLIIISIFISIWVCDSAAYYVGSSIGKHKLFPRVSPNKSWEGSIAGFIFAVAAMVISKYTYLDFLSLDIAIVIGIITGVIGQIGDLFESLIKRDAAVKDSSNIIPGHGGILDRFDSLLLAAPAVYLVLRYMGR